MQQQDSGVHCSNVNDIETTNTQNIRFFYIRFNIELEQILSLQAEIGTKRNVSIRPWKNWNKKERFSSFEDEIGTKRNVSTVGAVSLVHRRRKIQFFKLLYLKNLLTFLQTVFFIMLSMGPSYIDNIFSFLGQMVF
jgi:hypothetical protein